MEARQCGLEGYITPFHVTMEACAQHSTSTSAHYSQDGSMNQLFKSISCNFIVLHPISNYWDLHVLSVQRF